MNDLEVQAEAIARDIVENMPSDVLKRINKEAKIKELKKRELVALIAYLQRLGTDIKVKSKN
jgi:cytochrome c oxidase cbb3-type subunit I/II